MKKFITLDKKWKEIVYAASGFGPNLLMILMGAFYTDAVNPKALPVGSVQAISDICLVTPVLFAILMIVAKAFDGIIDIPMASITDNFKSKLGKRRLPMLICFLPMVIAYVLLWIPIGGTTESANITLNTAWFIIWCLIFFATYTMVMICFYGSLSTVCYDDSQRLRVSSFKSFFDTITYCLVYALVPVILSGLNLHIDKLALYLVPVMATSLIPIFMIKEGEKFEKKAIAEGYDITPLAEEEKVGILESIKLTFTNKPFVRWCAVNACTYFGLQMFLLSMNTLITGGMALGGEGRGWCMTVLNTCAFAPVPIMLYLFNKMKAKKGIRFTYQTCLVSFAICILQFVICNEVIMGPDNVTTKMIIGCIGGVAGSWAIGSFFMMPYLIPAQVSSVEEKLTGKNHSAMYFAGQAIVTSLSGALATGVYEIIKNVFFTKDFRFVWVDSLDIARETAANLLNVEVSQVFNLGTFVVPFFVSFFCIFGVLLAFRMPKNYTAHEVAKLMNLEKEYLENKHLFPEEDTRNVKDESLIVNIALWVLSGSIFGFIWNYGITKDSSSVGKKIPLWQWIVSIFIPMFAGIIYFQAAQNIKNKCDELSIKTKNYKVISLILGLIGLGLIPQIILQYQLNKIAKYE